MTQPPLHLPPHSTVRNLAGLYRAADLVSFDELSHVVRALAIPACD